MRQILIVAGTRPEIIKIAPIILYAKHHGADRLHVKLCLTGQHQSMAQEALSIFEIEPDADLEIMRHNQTLNDISRAVYERLPQVLERFAPDVLLVQGDTTTAAVSALCAFNMKIPVGHVEAGLRSFNLEAPYPEECNRRIISCLATYNFCPTDAARDNLRKESAREDTLFVTGNTIVDAIHVIRENKILDDLASVHADVKEPFVLITAHRRESFGEGFKNICTAIRECALSFKDYQFIYPVHLNPNVQEPVHALLKDLPNVLLIRPVPYLQLLTLLKHCTFVLTDSGGIQEEAPSFGKYCIVMRDVTERMESVHLGLSELVGTDVKKIVAAARRAASGSALNAATVNPYGDGHAAKRILDILTNGLAN
jgi:UDP-N-acetylglucosamine 2-epimerase (non-hydrolysing)